MTETGLTRITGDDFWTAIDEYREYVVAQAGEPQSAPLQIVASSGPVVHVESSAGSSFGAVGQADHAIIGQSSSWNLTELAAEIKSLREAVADSSADRDAQLKLGALAEAEIAAECGDADRTATALRRAGAWVGDNANKLGLAVLEAFVKQHLGL